MIIGKLVYFAMITSVNIDLMQVIIIMIMHYEIT